MDTKYFVQIESLWISDVMNQPRTGSVNISFTEDKSMAQPVSRLWLGYLSNYFCHLNAYKTEQVPLDASEIDAARSEWEKVD